MEDKLYEVKNITKGDDIVELTHHQVMGMLLSGGFMAMFNRMQIGEELFYNDRNLNFKRIK